MRKPNYIVRELTDKDSAAFRQLRLEGLETYPEAFGQTAQHFAKVSESEIAQRIIDSRKNGAFILGGFADNKELCGIVGLGRNAAEKCAHRAFIWGMYVSKNTQRQGLGSQLITECLERASKLSDITQVHLSVVTGNKTALKLYQSYGFEIYGEDPAALKIGNQTYDEYLMVKFMNQGNLTP